MSLISYFKILKEGAEKDNKKLNRVYSAFDKFVDGILVGINIEPFETTILDIVKQCVSITINDELVITMVSDSKFKAVINSRLYDNKLLYEILLHYDKNSPFIDMDVIDSDDFRKTFGELFRSMFVHEYTHYLDKKEVKSVNSYHNSIINLIDKGEYYNTPSEFNAHYFQILDDIKSNIPKFKGVSFDDFIKFLKIYSETFNILSVKLNEKYKKSLLKRLSKLFDDIKKGA